jgi:cystathionine beta-lyase
MKYDFSTSLSRENSNAEKYTLRIDKFGTNNITPVWVADMDINSPIFVKKAIQKRLNHSIYGYEMIPNSAYKAQIKWLKKMYNIKYDIKDIFYSHSVVASINVAIEAFSEIGDNIIVQTPIYPPFFTSILHQQREVLYNPLIKNKSGMFKMDLKSLKKQINKKTKLLLLCNPHNPTGRSWDKKELKKLLDICIKNNIIVFSDEIHCDLVYDNSHIAFSSLHKAKDITISTYGIGKTFNLSGLSMSTVYIQNNLLKKRFYKVYKKYHFADGNVLSHVAFQEVYTNGQIWLKELKKHLYSNYIMLKKLSYKYQNLIKLTPIQATYLAWIDCSNMNMNDKQLKKWFIDEAKLGLNSGISFGKAGSLYMRLNFAVSKDKMLDIIKQLDTALKNKI